LQALLKSRFLVYTGTISYGIYLLEKLPVDAVKALHLERFPLLAFSIATIMTYAMAALSWNVLEKPFLKLRRFFGGPVACEDLRPDEIVNAV
jgi:peptidoglycan/LPS O-acetylase OafA/YrhL